MLSMPPRSQCLNAVRNVKQQISISKAAFSTAARALANRPTPSAADELLSSIESQPARIQLPFHRYKPERSALEDRPPQPPTSRTNANANEHMKNLLNQATSGAAARQASASDLIEMGKLATSLSRQIHRRWKAGDVYAPHDLSSAEMKKWSKKGKPQVDAFDVLDLNPLEEYKNFSIMSEYMTPMGRIMNNTETGLRGVNQRRIAKAIRRSIGLGLMPSVHRHPEILYKQNNKITMQTRRW